MLWLFLVYGRQSWLWVLSSSYTPQELIKSLSFVKYLFLPVFIAFLDLPYGYPHLVHSFICYCWWLDGCKSSPWGGNYFLFRVFLVGDYNGAFPLFLCALCCADLWQIRSLEMLHRRFETFPEAFTKNLVSPRASG